MVCPVCNGSGRVRIVTEVTTFSDGGLPEIRYRREPARVPDDGGTPSFDPNVAFCPICYPLIEAVRRMPAGPDTFRIKPRPYDQPAS